MRQPTFGKLSQANRYPLNGGQADGISRRKFLKHAAAMGGVLTVPHIIPASALGRAGTVAPSNRIVVGCIGVGGMGKGDMSMCLALPDVQVVAVCDPKRDMRDGAKPSRPSFPSCFCDKQGS